MARNDPQLNVRFKPDRHAILEAAAFVEQTTILDLVKPTIEKMIDSYAAEPAITQALRARADHQAAEEGRLSRILQTRSGSSGTS